MGAQIDVVGQVATDEVPLEYLEREICQLGSNIAAATCRWLLLLAEFDRREGWAVWGARSCAEWLSWRCVFLGLSGASSTAGDPASDLW